MVIKEVADGLNQSIEEIETLIATDDKLKGYLGSHIKGDGDFSDRSITATGVMAIKEAFARQDTTKTVTKTPVNDKKSATAAPTHKSAKNTNTPQNTKDNGVKSDKKEEPVKERHRRTKAEIEAEKTKMAENSKMTKESGATRKTKGKTGRKRFTYKIEKTTPFADLDHLPVSDLRKLLIKERPAEELALMDDNEVKQVFKKTYKGILTDDTLHLYPISLLI